MIIKFSDWNVSEARTYSDEKFDWILQNMGNWILDEVQNDPLFRAKIQRLKEFRDFEQSKQFTLDSEQTKVRDAMDSFEKYLHTISSKSSNDFIKQVKDLSQNISQKIVAYGKPEGFGTGKRGRPVGSKNKPRITKEASEQIAELNSAITGLNTEIFLNNSRITETEKSVNGAKRKIEEMQELIERGEKLIEYSKEKIIAAEKKKIEYKNKINKLEGKL